MHHQIIRHPHARTLLMPESQLLVRDSACAVLSFAQSIPSLLVSLQAASHREFRTPRLLQLAIGRTDHRINYPVVGCALSSIVLLVGRDASDETSALTQSATVRQRHSANAAVAACGAHRVALH